MRLYRLTFVLPSMPEHSFFSAFVPATQLEGLKLIADEFAERGFSWRLETHGINPSPDMSQAGHGLVPDWHKIITG